MDIKEATKKAHELGTGFYRSDDVFNIIIVPTNTKNCCIICPNDEKTKYAGRWNPSLEDLISEKWQVVQKVDGEKI